MVSKNISVTKLTAILGAHSAFAGRQVALALEELDPDRTLNFQHVPAQKFLRTIRSKYLEKAAALGELEASLIMAGDADLLLGQFYLGEEAILILLDEDELPIFASIYGTKPREAITATTLRRLLRESPGLGCAVAIEMMDESPDGLLPIAVQPADRTAATFRVKYSLAQKRGVLVEGLENFVSRLSGMAGLPVALCYLSADNKAAIVALNAERESVLAIVCVTY